MFIENNILKHYLKNCYFINGTAYAGKSTMCAMLAELFNMVIVEKIIIWITFLNNFKKCIARINSPERYEAFKNSGFFTLVRKDGPEDIREEMLSALAEHFKLEP